MVTERNGKRTVKFCKHGKHRKQNLSLYIYIYMLSFIENFGGGGGGGVGGLVSVRNTYTGRLARVSPNLVTGKTWKVDFHDLMIFTSSQSTSKMVLDFP